MPMPDLAGQRTIKRFRVAREGVTVDGREITRQQIIDMAKDYDPCLLYTSPSPRD